MPSCASPCICHAPALPRRLQQPLRVRLFEAAPRLAAEEARFYHACAVCGVERLHRSGWIHRDLKLENMMLSSTGYAKIIDAVRHAAETMRTG